MPKTELTVKLIGKDGNAFAIMGVVSKALKKAGYHDLASQYLADATMGDYDHLLRTTMEYVDVE